MPLRANQPTEMTQREWDEFAQQKELFTMQSEHSQKIRAMELEIEQLQVKRNSWTMLPVFIIMLPVRFVLAFGYIIMAIRGKEPGSNFWKFMR